MTLKIFPLCILLLLPLLILGQEKEFTLSGSIYIKDGPVSQYYVVFRANNNNNITGYSLTKQPDGSELKALVSGKIDRKHHKLTFKESKMPLSVETDNCMFDVALSYVIKDSGYAFSGTFKGKNSNNDTCDEGAVSLIATKENSRIFEPHKPPVPIIETKPIEPATPSVNEFAKITATTQTEFDWHSDTCIIDIWDGEVVDGDIISMDIDGQILLSYYVLTASKKQLRVPLKKRANTIHITAINEGKAPPNTSMILLTDGKNQYGVLSCIRIGETSEIIINRK